VPESAYQRALAHGQRLEHHYGPNVHILADSWSLGLLARMSHPETRTPDLHVGLHAAYRRLLEATCEQLPTIPVDWPTRMTAGEPRARFQGRIVDPAQRVVVVDVARAGMIPAHIMQQGFHEVLDPAGVRVDHLFMDRVADPITGKVTGIAFHGSKIGGSVEGATLVVPDPMGATGRSIVHALEHYEAVAHGKPRKIITCHLIVTPEFIRTVTRRFPEAVIYALRLDRGLSAAEVLATPPGARWDDERGLNEKDYIVPGAGGLGELLNNAFI
jgi:uracil phosphoribosyltransferase